MRKKNRLVCGWGINDVDYVVCDREGHHCPYYLDWKSIITRCFNKNYQKQRPSYKGCTVLEEWKYLSNFVKWVDSQPNKDWQNCALDKDLLLEGNKHYSPNNCAYISKSLNSFLIDRGQCRGDLMLGVSINSSRRSFRSNCNPLRKSDKKHLGYFNTELEAHKAWQAKKHQYACILADEQTDPRVAKALRERYAPDKDWTNK